MSRISGVLLLGVLWTMACRHAQTVEGAAQEADAKGETEKKPVAKEVPHKPAGQARSQARRESDVKRPAYIGRPELSTNAAGLMKEEGPMRIQKKLADAGYYKGEVTGELDAATTTALEKFQRDNELAGTGAPDRDTLKALGLDPDDIWRNQQKREKEELKERREKHEEKEKEETPRS